ncbi:hypothetical protein SAICODRAFT_32230 [Saitoella complicata NRRL Y-17804]|nr:uncharacterized protein SAICODRAFT_32230 [Saitoella complicata NRRL Y-17804]ODQ49923.1 hypothetical protein SAICODRAFT_32230 [Saitoella complicata NRRL Y-17804]
MSKVNLAIVGAGLVGGDFIDQVASYNTRNPSTPLNVISISKSRTALLSQDFAPISLTNWRDALASATTAAPSPAELAQWLSTSPLPVILVDNTSSPDMADAYPLFASKKIHIATPNKKAFSSSNELFQKIQAAAKESGALIYHEASVGAGLPVISTLNDLVATGDRVTKIEGIFSGTLSYIFNEWSPSAGPGTAAFSDVVRVAKEKGYTEPDPRDDLNGLDVARKLTILARLSGLEIESPTSFPVHSLIPSALESATSGDEFLAGLPAHDSEIAQLRTDAESKGQVIRFVGSIDVASKSVAVKLAAFEKSHPFASLKGSDNIISFYTERYGASPLIVQGAGAGAAVTAMGVLADCLKIAGRV